MKIIFDFGHPKDINVFSNVISILKSKGHEIKIVARDKENIRAILNELGLEAEYGSYYKNIFAKSVGVLQNDIWLYGIAKEYQPDIFVSFGSPYCAHTSRLLRRPHIAFIDTEIATFAIKLMIPFTHTVYTSTSFTRELGKKHKRFNSYLELAYLSPKYFLPNRDVLSRYNLKEKSYIILRLSALASHHDLKAQGFSFDSENDLQQFIERLNKYGRVIVFSETHDWNTIEKHSLNINPKDFHDILFYSKMCIGEGATMVSESAILGIPSFYVSSTRRGYLDELEEKYDLCYTVRSKMEVLEKAILLLQDETLQDRWDAKRATMLADKLDMVSYIINEVETHLQSK